MPSIRAILIYLVSLAVVFGLSFGIGYVYQYDPERDLVELVIDRSADVPGEGSLASGIIRAVSDDAVTVETESGTIEIAIADVILEELLPLEDPSSVGTGSTVNLGGERTSTERVITGLVFVDGEVQP